MFVTFIGVNGRIINLNALSLIEDESTATESRAKLTTIDGLEIELTGEDAEALFARVQLLLDATDKTIQRLVASNSDTL
jgi:molybdopterin/thiamine biosynthesis adenylyltransferase